MAGHPIWYELMTPDPGAVAPFYRAVLGWEPSGGTVTHDIHEVPGGDFIFTATDPAGAPVAFVGPKGA